MARQTVTGRRRKTGGNTGYVQCQRCHGTGRVRKGGNARSGRSSHGGGGSRG